MSNTITIAQELSPESLAQIRQMMEDVIRTANRPAADEDALLLIEDAASLLHVSVDTIRCYVRAKQFPAYKKNKLLYFSKQELTDWIKSGPRKPGVRFRAKAK